MIIYEVNLSIDKSIYMQYMQWLKPHVTQMLSCPGFESAALYESKDLTAKTESHELTIHYQVKDEIALMHYLKEFAPKLQAEGKELFGDKFTATRRILTPA